MTKNTKTKPPRPTLRIRLLWARKDVFETRQRFNLVQKELRFITKCANALEEQLFGTPRK